MMQAAPEVVAMGGPWDLVEQVARTVQVLPLTSVLVSLLALARELVLVSKAVAKEVRMVQVLLLLGC